MREEDASFHMRVGKQRELGSAPLAARRRTRRSVFFAESPQIRSATTSTVCDTLLVAYTDVSAL